MKKAIYYGVIATALVCMALAGCSGNKDSEPAKANSKTATQEAAEAVKEYGKRPLDKARAAQQMGEDRVNAIDEAVKQK
jgi:hypothetical protein